MLGMAAAAIIAGLVGVFGIIVAQGMLTDPDIGYSKWTPLMQTIGKNFPIALGGIAIIIMFILIAKFLGGRGGV